MSEDHRNDVTTTAENPLHRRIKRPRDSIEGVDSISSLPDAILQHIFSLIPTKLAITTSVLSKRWRHVWSETPSLNIDCHRPKPDPMIETLGRYTAPKITSFRLSISNIDNDIDSLIDLAVSRNTEKLSVEFHHHYDADYRFPEVFYNSCSLKQLFIESGIIDMIPGHTVSWTSLKTLSLMSCVVSDEACAKILSGSPLLECLTLFCDKLQFLDLSESIKLKRLDVQCWEPMLQIVAPHLHCLKLTHSDESKCDLVDVSSLTEVNVNTYFSRRLDFLYDDLADSLQVMILETLDKLQNVEKLALSGAFSLQILSLAVLSGVPFPMFNVKDLTLETAIYPSIIPGVAKLLQNSPRLKKIKLDIVDCNIIEESCFIKYLYWKGLYTRECWKPKDLDEPSFSEPKLMTSIMKFLLETSGDHTVGSYIFSQINNSQLSFVSFVDSYQSYLSY